MEIPNPCKDLDEILHTHPCLSKEGFGAVLQPWPPQSPRPGGLKRDKLEGTFTFNKTKYV